MATVYDRLEKEEQKYLEGVPKNIVDYLQELNSMKKGYEDKIKNVKGKIEYAENLINSTTIDNKKVFDKDEELSLARQELSFLTTNDSKANKEKQQKIVDSLLNQISQLEKQINELDTKMKTGKKIYLSIKSESDVYCPMCEQKIENESKLATIKNMKKDLENAFENKKKLDTDLMDIKSKMVVERCKLHAIENIPDTNNKEHIESVKAQIQGLEQEQLEIEKYNNAILLTQKNIDAAKNDIEIFKKQIKDNNSLIENIKKTKDIAEKLYINYIEEKMEFATQHLKNVKIRYYTVLKESGELKDDFIITYNNNEQKTLSRSETIATSIELCNMFNKISGVNIPLFIDDSESCADYNFVEEYSQDTQILITKVQKNTQLTITDYYNNVADLQIAA